MIDDSVEIMTTLNKTAAEIMVQVGVSACTDVTGYGLLGHLLEMCKGAKLSAEIEFDKIEFIDGAIDAASNGIVPGGTKRNLNFIRDNINFSRTIDETKQHLLADAQTSGGLLISVPENKVQELESKLTESECFAMNIGKIGTVSNEEFIRVV